MSKKILIEIPDSAVDTLNTLKDQDKELTQTKIINSFLWLIENLNKDCYIVAFDENNVKFLDKFEQSTDTSRSNNDVRELNLSVKYDGTKVSCDGNFTTGITKLCLYKEDWFYEKIYLGLHQNMVV